MQEVEEEKMAWTKVSRHARGYGATWDKLRILILSRDCGLCQVCLAIGRVTLATEVDHIKAKADGGTDDENNLRAICHPCHVAATCKQQGKKRRPAIGADGWPCDE